MTEFVSISTPRAIGQAWAKAGFDYNKSPYAQYRGPNRDEFVRGFVETKRGALPIILPDDPRLNPGGDQGGTAA